MPELENPNPHFNFQNEVEKKHILLEFKQCIAKIREGDYPIKKTGPNEASNHKLYNPWLFISSFKNDRGLRPFASPVAYWATIDIQIETFQANGNPGKTVSLVKENLEYQIKCTISNAGYAPSFGTFVEFYSSVTTGNNQDGPLKAIGNPIVGITVPAGGPLRLGSKTVRSNMWKPSLGLHQCIIVRCYDPISPNDPPFPISKKSLGKQTCWPI